MRLHLTQKYSFVLLMFWSSGVIAQPFVAQNSIRNETARPVPSRPDPIEFISPKGVDISQSGRVIYKHTGNVKLRHRGVMLFCDQAIHDITANRIEATGHVLIVQGDTTIVKGDTMTYSGDNRRASLRGRVTFQDRRIILNASRIDYDLTAGIAHYVNGGRLVDSRNVLTSREGYYDTKTRQIELQYTARLVSPENTLTSDILVYNTVSRMVAIVEPTRILGKNGVSVARQGQYDTQEGQLQQNEPVQLLKYVKTTVPDGDNMLKAGITESGKTGLTKVDKTTETDQKSRLVRLADGAAPTGATAKPAETLALPKVAEPKVSARPPVNPADEKQKNKSAGNATTIAVLLSGNTLPTAKTTKPAPVKSAAIPTKAEKSIVITQAIQPVDPTDPLIAGMTVAKANGLTDLAPVADKNEVSDAPSVPVRVELAVAPIRPVAIPPNRTPAAATPTLDRKRVVKTPNKLVKPIPTPTPVPDAATTLVPVKRPEEQVALPVVTPASTQPAVSVAPRTVSAPNASSGLIRRTAVRPALKKVTAPVVNTIPDANESDLERELNRKKRFN